MTMYISGEAFKLELDGPLYVGGLDPSLEPYRVPPVLWTASLRKGYVGCLRDLVINGYTVDIAQFASQQDSGREYIQENVRFIMSSPKSTTSLETRFSQRSSFSLAQDCG